MTPAKVPLRAVSYGGGVQSTALLVLAAQRRIDYPLFVMANVGDDSEDPLTLSYVTDHAVPYAAEHGIELQIIDKLSRDGDRLTLLGKLTRPGSQSTSIPFRSRRDGPPMSRSCTAEFKVRVLGKYLRSRGASETNIATVALGISLDEIHRATDKVRQSHERVVYPLIGVGEDTGLKMTRMDCQRLVADAGLPIPPKSSCWFCPHHKISVWEDMRRERPNLFEKACGLEDHLRERNVAAGKGPVFLSRAGIPLRDAIDSGQTVLDLDDAACDSGYCFT